MDTMQAADRADSRPLRELLPALARALLRKGRAAVTRKQPALGTTG
jgi:hypothetical protein